MVACASRGRLVLVDEPAEAFAAGYVQFGRPDADGDGDGRACLRRLERERAVRPVPVVVTDVDAEDVVEVASVQDQNPVEAVATERSDPALGVGVSVRGPDGGGDDPDALAAKDGIEVEGELTVAVADEILEPTLSVVELHHEVARLLRYPAAVRVGR